MLKYIAVLLVASSLLLSGCQKIKGPIACSTSLGAIACNWNGSSLVISPTAVLAALAAAESGQPINVGKLNCSLNVTTQPFSYTCGDGVAVISLVVPDLATVSNPTLGTTTYGAAKATLH